MTKRLVISKFEFENSNVLDFSSGLMEVPVLEINQVNFKNQFISIGFGTNIGVSRIPNGVRRKDNSIQ